MYQIRLVARRLVRVTLEDSGTCLQGKESNQRGWEIAPTARAAKRQETGRRNSALENDGPEDATRNGPNRVLF